MLGQRTIGKETFSNIDEKLRNHHDTAPHFLDSFSLEGLKDSINDFNRNNNYLLNCKKTWKLHILIPLSCEVYDDLQKVDSHIQFINNLPELKMDRAGIKNRSYKNSVYGVMDEGQKVCFLSLLLLHFSKTLSFLNQDSSNTS